MAKMIVKKDAGWTRNVLMCDLHRTLPGCGEEFVGKARVTFFVPMESKESDDVGTQLLKDMSRSINMDVLWFSQYERGWVDGYITDDDIPDEELKSLIADESSILGTVNKHLTENGFWICVS